METLCGGVSCSHQKRAANWDILPRPDQRSRNLTIIPHKRARMEIWMPSPAEATPAVLAELNHILTNVDAAEFDHFCQSVSRAHQISLYGLGREGLALRGFGMRLMHLGFDAHIAGDVTAQPIGAGDLLIVTSGPGNLTLTAAMIELGRRSGAQVAVVTAQSANPDPQAADLVLTIPAQTMADDQVARSVFLMGSAFEIAMGIIFDLAVMRLVELTGQTTDQIRARHTNLE
jgi:6-phospho-3-hexuloisomerase